MDIITQEIALFLFGSAIGFLIGVGFGYLLSMVNHLKKMVKK